MANIKIALALTERQWEIVLGACNSFLAGDSYGEIFVDPRDDKAENEREWKRLEAAAAAMRELVARARGTP